MDDLKLGVVPEEDEEELARCRAAGIYDLAERVVNIAFDKKELYDLCQLLESFAVGEVHYHRVAECVIFVEKIRSRWTAHDLERRSTRRKRG